MSAAVKTAAPVDVLGSATHHPLSAPQQFAPAEATSGNVVTLLKVLDSLLLRPDIDLDRAERLVRMANEMRAEEARLAWVADFARFTELGLVVPKTKHVNQRAADGGQGPKFWQSEYHVVSSILKPPLGRFGFGVRFGPVFQRATEAGLPWCEITCYLTHRLGHTESVTIGGPPDSSGSKNPLQEMQSSATFLMRHALLAITGTAQEGNDNDGRGARGYAEDQQTSASDDGQRQAARAALVKAGEEQAAKGTLALNAWWGRLTSHQRTDLSREFGQMRKTAAATAAGGAK